MHIHAPVWPRSIAPALLFVIASAAAAGETEPQSPERLPLLETPAVEAQAVASTDIPHVDSAFGMPLDVVRLHRLRGGDSRVNNDILVEGLVSDNTADGIVSGSNVVNGGSFANASGINTVIQNTGTNVLIQNAMIVNVQFTDAGP